MVRRKRSGGFYDRREPFENLPPQRAGGVSGSEGADEDEVRRRLRELVYREPEEKDLLLRAAKVMLGAKARGSEGMAERARAALEEQLLSGEDG